MTASQMTRRDLLKRGVTASLGAAMANAHSLSDTGLNGYAGLSSFAREYDQYDGLGLAELIAKKQITPLEPQ